MAVEEDMTIFDPDSVVGRWIQQFINSLYSLDVQSTSSYTPSVMLSLGGFVQCASSSHPSGSDALVLPLLEICISQCMSGFQ